MASLFKAQQSAAKNRRTNQNETSSAQNAPNLGLRLWEAILDPTRVRAIFSESPPVVANVRAVPAPAVAPAPLALPVAVRGPVVRNFSHFRDEVDQLIAMGMGRYREVPDADPNRLFAPEAESGAADSRSVLNIHFGPRS